MENYSIYLETENEKYSFIEITRQAGAVLAAVSGCGPGYHICLLATPGQADRINAAWTGAAV